MIHNLAILIRIGQFSYAEIRLKNFNSIIGVTGTPTSLNSVQQKIYKKNYEIKAQTITLSVYGRNNNPFDEIRDVILIESEENHYKMIAQEIRKKVEGSKRVAAFVFFESMEELYRFYNSNEFEPLKNYSQKFSKDFSEKIQCKGRTARQGESGSYQLIVSIKS